MIAPLPFITQDNKEVLVYPDCIMAVAWLKENNCTGILGSGGGLIMTNSPLAEVTDRVNKAKEQLILSAALAVKERKKNGISKR